MKQVLIKIVSLFLLLLIPFAVLAAGLGDMQVKSSLNEPINATIPIIDLGNVPFAAVKVKLASDKEFNAVGLKRDLNLLNLQFDVAQNKQQQFYIQVSSTQPIDQPVLTFLLQLYWPNGKILREYTVFLDPSNYPSVAQKSTVTSSSFPKKRTKIVVPSTTAFYGPTTRSDNLWEIAQKFAPSRQTSSAQMMVAIFQLNPQAFLKNNINGLKAGYRLVLPSTAQANAINNQYAEQLIVKQNNAWQMQTQTTVLPSARNIEPPVPAQNINIENNATSTINAAPIPRQPAEQGSSQTNPAVKASNPEPIPVPASTAPQTIAPASSIPQMELLPPVTPAEPSLLGSESDLIILQSGAANESTTSNQTIDVLKTANQALQLEVRNLRAQLRTLQTQLTHDEQALSVLKNKTSAGAASVQTTQAQTTQTAVKLTAPVIAHKENFISVHRVLLGSLFVLALIVIGALIFREKIRYSIFIQSWKAVKS
ncbi:MAG: hypothetical protein K2Q14_08000, partial [Gammaproteobacteria bacterium]|nr:hypothetical protein [Gammaproteobacteria bacterium]